MEKTKIYGLIDPIDGLIKYIGKTSDLTYRLKNHIKNSLKEKSGLTKKEAWIKSLHNKNLKPEIIEIDEVLNKEWGFWEKHYISLYRSWGFELKNMTEGGDGWGKGVVPWNKGIPHNEEFKKVLSDLKIGPLNNRYGVKLPKEVVEKIQKKRNKKIKEIGEKISKSKKGVKQSEEHKKKLSQVRKGRIPWNKGKTGYSTKKKGNNIISEEMKKRISEKLTKHKIIQKDLNGNFIKEWLKMELKSEGFSVSYITNVCLGNRNKAYGFKWEYKK